MITHYKYCYKGGKSETVQFTEIQLSDVSAKESLAIKGYISHVQALEQVNSWNRQISDYRYWID